MENSFLPQHDRDAERYLLGALLRDPTAVSDASAFIKADQFYVFGHQVIFEAIVELQNAGISADVVSVFDRVSKNGKAVDCGGAGYIGELPDCWSGRSWKQYAEIVREKYLRRQIIHCANELMVSAVDLATPVEEIVSQTEQKVMEMAQGAVSAEAMTIQDAMRQFWGRMDARRGGEDVQGVMTGWIDLDNILSGFRGGDLVLIAARPSVGKAQPLEAKVLTPEGFVTMGSLKVGQHVIGVDGKPTQIVAVHERGSLPVFRVKMNDGTATECCDDHLWWTSTRNERRAIKSEDGSVKSLKDIRATIIRPDSKQTPNHSIPTVQPIEFSPQPPQSVHPYVLGVLLGDGCLTKETVEFSNPEADIANKVAALLPEVDELSSNGLTHRIRKLWHGPEKTQTWLALDELGLIGKDSYTKFIPIEYLQGSIEARVALLQGLLDTDGYVCDSATTLEISSSSPQMAQGIEFIVRSLGGIITSSQKTPTYSYKGEKKTGEECARMTFSFQNGIVPVTSTKHLAKLKTGDRRPAHRTITAVDSVGEKICRCITVATADGLYVTDDFIVTHNSACGLQIAMHAAMEQGVPTLFCALEQSSAELCERLIVNEARLDSHRVRTGRLSCDDMEKLLQAGARLGDARLWIDAEPSQSILRIGANARRYKQRHRIGLLVVDYIQLIETDQPRSPRHEQVGSFSRRLKILAKQLDIPIVAMAQVNRGSEDRSNRKPRLSDLRESGSLEQDADTVILLHRPEDPGKEGVCEVNVAKQRNGPTGEIELIFSKNCMRFENMAMQS